MARYAVIINGAAGVGKDTFVELCGEPAERIGYTVCNFSSVDRLKIDLFPFDKPYDKSDEHRQMLVDAKQRLMAEDPEYFARGLTEQITSADPNSVSFLHIREPEQIVLSLGYFAEHLADVETSTLLIVRAGLHVPQNVADGRVEEYTDYDETVINDSDLSDLAFEAERFIRDTVSPF